MKHETSLGYDLKILTVVFEVMVTSMAIRLCILTLRVGLEQKGVILVRNLQNKLIDNK
jgi:hypothetical protein